MLKETSLITKILLILFLVTAPDFSSGAETPSAEKAREKDASGSLARGTANVTLRIPLISPLFSKFPVAIVNGEQILLEDIANALEATHGEIGETKQRVKMDYLELMRRLINTRLILQEAKNIGLNELPEIKKMVSVYSMTTIRDLLLDDFAKDAKIEEADGADIDKLYKDKIKEWKIKSVIFEKEENAKKMEEELRAGKGFDEVAAQMVKEGTAKGGEEGKFIKHSDLQPHIEQVVSKMETGSVSPIIKVGSGKKEGHVILKLEEVRYPDNPEAKERAREAVLNFKKEQAVKKHRIALYKKYLTINKKLINSLDFESKKPGLDKLLKDKRTIAHVKGEKAVTVGDLAQALKEKFFHGIERAIEGKQVNKKKLDVLGEILEKQVLMKEALKRGIDKTSKYKDMVKDYENSVVFGAFVQKAVVPEVKLTEDDVKAYYNEHISEFTYPEMIKMASLAFKTSNDAGTTIEKLKKGVDFNWVKANADGQIEPKSPGLLTFDGTPIITKDLPEGIQKAVAGVKANDFRLYQSPEGYFYVLAVQDVIPAAQQPYEELRNSLAKKVFNEKSSKVLEEWAKKLRESATIETYMAGSDKQM